MMKKTDTGSEPFGVAIGLGNNVDYELDCDMTVLQRLLDENAVEAKDIHAYKEVNNEKEILASILYLMSQGSGSEIFIGSTELVMRFASNFSYKATMGGTGIRAALAMDKFGKRSCLHIVTINDEVRRELPKNCQVICSQTRDSLYPHLIIQYKAGDTLKFRGSEITAASANRIIYTNDPDNTLLPLNMDFGEMLKTARIFLLSGTNVITDEAVLEDRIDKILILLDNMPPDSYVYVESGCYFKPEFQEYIMDRLHSRISIFSMNEEEMQLSLNRSIDLLDADGVFAAMKEIRKNAGIPYIIVHTHLWAAIIGENAGKFIRNLTDAVTMATTRYRFGDGVTPENFAETGTLPVAENVSSFIKEITDIGQGNICCVPVPTVSEENVTTIGLGDSFAGGFMFDFA